MDATLVIMAAGLGSRYKNGIKQLSPVGPNGEVIMDYSIHDAKEAGFNKVVFVIRKDIEEEFKKTIGDKVSKIMKVSYAFQEISNVPVGYEKADRIKPWGTVHAILCAKDYVNEPFLVINADDYYGKNGYKMAYDFLTKTNDKNYCMIGFSLKNTMSKNGSVNRGICQIDNESYLKEVIETRDINYINNNIVGHVNGEEVILNEEDNVSMNMWGFLPNIFEEMYDKWVEFLDNLALEDLTSEYLLPDFIDYMIKNNKANIKLLKTDDVWFGVTYQEDRIEVEEAFKKLVKKGVYKNKLY